MALVSTNIAKYGEHEAPGELYTEGDSSHDGHPLRRERLLWGELEARR